MIPTWQAIWFWWSARTLPITSRGRLPWQRDRILHRFCRYPIFLGFEAWRLISILQVLDFYRFPPYGPCQPWSRQDKGRRVMLAGCVRLYPLGFHLTSFVSCTYDSSQICKQRPKPGGWEPGHESTATRCPGYTLP